MRHLEAFAVYVQVCMSRFVVCKHSPDVLVRTNNWWCHQGCRSNPLRVLCASEVRPPVFKLSEESVEHASPQAFGSGNIPRGEPDHLVQV